MSKLLGKVLQNLTLVLRQTLMNPTCMFSDCEEETGEPGEPHTSAMTVFLNSLSQLILSGAVEMKQEHKHGKNTKSLTRRKTSVLACVVVRRSFS